MSSFSRNMERTFSENELNALARLGTVTDKQFVVKELN